MNLVATENEKVTSFYDGRAVTVKKNLDCCTANVVYLLQCTRHNKQYTGSSVNFKGRWSKHRCDMVKAKGEDCGFCKHWARDHADNPQDLSCVKIVFVDQINDPGAREDDFPNLKKLEGKWMANLGCLVSMDREHGLNIKDDAKPRQKWNQ